MRPETVRRGFFRPHQVCRSQPESVSFSAPEASALSNFAQRGSLDLNGQISGAGSLIVKQPDVVTLNSQTNSFTGGATVDGPTFGRLYAKSLGSGR